MYIENLNAFDYEIDEQQKTIEDKMDKEFECSICGVVYPSESEAKDCCASRKDRKELEEQNRT